MPSSHQHPLQLLPQHPHQPQQEDHTPPQAAHRHNTRNTPALTLLPVPADDAADAAGEVGASGVAHNAAAAADVVADSIPEAVYVEAHVLVVVVEAHTHAEDVQQGEEDAQQEDYTFHTHTSVVPAEEQAVTTHEDDAEAGAANVAVEHTAVQLAEAASQHTHMDHTSADGAAHVAAVPTPDSDPDTQEADNEDVEVVVVVEGPSRAPAVPLEEGRTADPDLPAHTADAEARTPAVGIPPFPFQPAPSPSHPQVPALPPPQSEEAPPSAAPASPLVATAVVPAVPLSRPDHPPQAAAGSQDQA